MKGKVGFLSIRAWALGTGLVVRTEKHLPPAPGDPLVLPGPHSGRQGWGPTVLPREWGAGRGQVEAGEDTSFLVVLPLCPFLYLC